MAFFVMGAFATGLAAGWLVRSSANSTREALVGLVAAAHHARDQVSRIIGQAMEWTEDLVAEGTAHYENMKPQSREIPPASVRDQVD
jgi:hypothetical protein